MGPPVPRHTPRTFRLDQRAIAQAGLSSEAPLCLARTAWGQTFALADRPPTTLEQFASEPEAPTAVGIVRVSGPLSRDADQLCGWYDGYEGEDGIVERFTETITAPEVGAVVLVFASPGGTSEGLEEAVRRMIEVRDASGKTVFAHVNEQCASAAYWIAAALANGGIFGPIAAECGSIGSYIPHTDYSGALAQEGIVETLIADPPGKVAGAGSQAGLDELGRARLERAVFACTARFIAGVSAARGLDEAAVRALDADCLPMTLAVEAGLADGLGSLEDVLSLAAATAAAPLGGPSMNLRSKARGGNVAHASLLAAGDPGSEAPTEPRYSEGDRVKIAGTESVGEVKSATVTDVFDVMVDGEDKPRRCIGDELEDEAPAVEPPPAEQRSVLPRSFAMSLVRASGLRPGASDAAAQAKATELLGLASHVMKATGAKTSAEARGVIASWQRAHGDLASVTRERDALAAKDEADARLSVLEEGIRLGVLTPGKAWKDGDKAKGLSAWASAPHKGPNGEQLGQSIEQLKADLKASSPLSFTGPPAAPKAGEISTLTEEEVQAAKRSGASAEEWEAARAAVLAGELPKAGSRKANTK